MENKHNITVAVATHNGTFHADEITAIALIYVFLEVNVKVSRMTHQSTKFDSFDYVVDVGREFDDVKRFDHHQWKGGQSSAGLIWEHVISNLQLDEYPEISDLIELVDAVDVGRCKAKDHEYPALVSMFNYDEPYQEAQLAQFHKAIDFAINTITALKRKRDLINTNSAIIDGYIANNIHDRILKFEQFVPFWSYAVNANNNEEFMYVYWFNDQGTWSAQVVPLTHESNEFHGPAFQPDSDMEFVHANGFYCVSNTEEQMVEYLLNNLKGSE